MNKRAGCLGVLLICNLLFFSNSFAQEAKIFKRSMTNFEFEKFKSLVGTYQEGKNYNQIINGHGTGLKPPTKEQWERIKTQPFLVDKVEVPFKMEETPAKYDNSTSKWFPPIGNQDGEGSCVAWACVYYTKTFQEAKEHNWDLSGCLWEGGVFGHPSPIYQDKIFNPDFIYHLVNFGLDNGASYYDVMFSMKNIGSCTWDKMPYDPTNCTIWPDENAWREAPWYRSQTGYNSMWVNSDAGIENLKELLVNGNLAVISIDANYFANFTSQDLWTLDNYTATGHNHANTIVGYDDNFGPYTESGKTNCYGAFKVANSWDVGGWEHIPDGFYYISYNCLKQKIPFVYTYENYINYQPQMVAVFEMNHDLRGENEINIGIGDPNSTSFLKSFNNFTNGGGNIPFPRNPIVIDITELLPYMSGTADQFFMKVNDGGTSTTGTIQYFSIEMYDDYSTGIPKHVYVSSEVPVNTLQGTSVAVNVFTSSETINITYPVGGEIFAVGSNPTIKYTSVGTSGHVNLYYSTNRGNTWNSIATNVVDNGEWKNWIVPNTTSPDCKIKISDVDGTPSVISKGLFRIGQDEFTEQTSISLTGVKYSSAAWGDYDNDGDLDLLITGNADDGIVSKIYRNNGNNSFTEQTSISLLSVRMGSVAWCDYNNDGYLDILLTGVHNPGEQQQFVSKIYHNNGNNTFTEQTSISLPGVSDASVAWGDFDNDGLPDILLTGLTQSNGIISRIYRNNGNNTFSEQTSISLIDVTTGSVAWGDYDNDGYSDILVTGESGVGRILSPPVDSAQFYRSKTYHPFYHSSFGSL